MLLGRSYIALVQLRYDTKMYSIVVCYLETLTRCRVVAVAIVKLVACPALQEYLLYSVQCTLGPETL